MQQTNCFVPWFPRNTPTDNEEKLAEQGNSSDRVKIHNLSDEEKQDRTMPIQLV